MAIITYRIITGMGMLNKNHMLSFLSDSEFEEFNKIGYTGKNSLGQRTNFTDFLNTLGKGEFQVDRIGGNSGEFEDIYLVIRVVTDETNKLENNKALIALIEREVAYADMQTGVYMFIDEHREELKKLL